MHFEVSRSIAAPPDTIWRCLIDKNTLLTGGFGILKLEGDIGQHSSIKLWSEASPKRPFPLRITRFDAPHVMVWEGGMPLGLFRGIRQFRIEVDGRKSRFTMREDYSGLLAGLIGKSIPDLSPSFEKFADALKRTTEGA